MQVLQHTKQAAMITKSNLILGMGEHRDENSETPQELRDTGATLSRSLSTWPSMLHHPVTRWVDPAEFEEWHNAAERLGLVGVMSGPLVRSSYRAGRLCRQALGAIAARA